MAVFTGTSADDRITPTSISAGVIADPAGNLPGSSADVIYGYGGDDYIEGGGGDDTIYAGDGEDVVYGGAGNDQLYAGSYDSSEDPVDYIDGGEGDDTLYGGVRGTLVGGRGNDHYELGDGDWLKIGANVIEAPNSGYDSVYVHQGGSGFDFSLPENVEKGEFFAYSSVGTIRGNDSNNLLLIYQEEDAGSGGRIFGLSGNDRIISQSQGADVIDGGSGADYMYGNAFDDFYYVDNAGDEVEEVEGDYDYYPGGTDTVQSTVNFTLGTYVENLILAGTAKTGTGNELANEITGNASANVLRGFAGDDRLNGGTGADQLYGGTGNDRLDGGAGKDSLRGEGGNDQYIVDDSGDKVVEAASGGTDTVYSTVSYTLATNVEAIQLTGTGNVNATGNALGNQITGNSYANKLRGLGGNDTLLSGNGADILIGGTGNDVIKFLSIVGSIPAARDTLRSGDGAMAFEKAGAAKGDVIDLSQIDANETASGTQHFVFGTATGIGRLWATTSGTLTLIRGNTDTDAAAEFELAIDDGGVTASAYAAADFLLS